MLRSSLALLALSMPAMADYSGGSFQQAQSRFGVLQVIGAAGAQRLVFNGTDLGVQNHGYDIEGVWATEGGSQDWAVIFSRHGGSMCGGGDYIMIMMSARIAVRTEEFGTCRGRPTDIRITPQAVELDISDPAPRISHQTFRFDGQTMTQTAVAMPAAPPAGAGPDVTRWLSGPYDLTQDASEQARFAAIMTPEQIDQLSARLSGPGRVEQQGNWVVGQGCQAHQCNVASAWWAIRIADGRPLAIFFDGDPSRDGGPATQTFGFREGDWADPEIRSFLEATLP